MQRLLFFSVLALALSSLSIALPTSSKIVGGEFAGHHQFPYQVALFFKDRFRCGGSIIDRKWILTAAHCVLDGETPIAAEDLEVFAGSSSFVIDGRYFTVFKVYPHENYGDSKNDIALIELDVEIKFDATMAKVELFNGELKDGDEVVISGYGRVGMDLPPSEQLKFNTMYVQDDELCSFLMAQTGPGLVCLNNEANNGACMGDSGGPAVYQGKLIGVANFVLNECGTIYPDGYAKVSFYRDWIDGVMKQ